MAVAVDGSDRVYVIDGNRIRRLDARDAPTVAGTGAQGFSGDGGPATHAQLSSPAAIAFDSEGNLHIADAGNNRIRRVGRDGIITTVVGIGRRGYGGDGGPGTLARLNSPAGVAVGLGDSVFVADTGNNRGADDLPRRHDHDLCRYRGDGLRRRWRRREPGGVELA